MSTLFVKPLCLLLLIVHLPFCMPPSGGLLLYLFFYLEFFLERGLCFPYLALICFVCPSPLALIISGVNRRGISGVQACDGSVYVCIYMVLLFCLNAFGSKL